MAEEKKRIIPGANWRKANNRPIRLSQALIEEVCLYIRNGNYLDTAAVASGIPRPTLENWLKRARRALQLDPIPDAEIPYVTFLQEVQKATAIAEKNNLARIERAGHSDWKAAAWLQARRYSKRWGDTVTKKVEHSGSVEHNHQHSHDIRELLSGMSLEQKKKMLEQIRAKQAEQAQKLEQIRSQELPPIEEILPDEEELL